MRILITGGFGYIGARLAQHLHQAGHQVILGSRNTNHPPSWLPNAETAKIDWSDNQALEKICTGVDVVIQAAGMNAQDCAANPITALEVNGLATAKLLDAATRASVKRFIYLSTAHVYANPLVGVISEDTCPQNLHPYATSHIAGENYVLAANQQSHIGNKIEGVVLRLSNAFGAPAHKDANCWMLLVNDLCKQAVTERSLTLQTAGLQRRDFIALEEVCRVIEHLSVCVTDTLSSKVINVGSGVSQSVLEMAQLIQLRCKILLGFEPEIQRPVATAPEKYALLEYRTDKLAGLGFNMVADGTGEIDKLLAFCEASFNQSNSANT